jgi:hypothetical protein
MAKEEFNSNRFTPPESRVKKWDSEKLGIAPKVTPPVAEKSGKAPNLVGSESKA